MSHLFKLFVDSRNEENRGFKMVPAIAMLVLILTFEGAIIYILISSWLQP